MKENELDHDNDADGENYNNNILNISDIKPKELNQNDDDQENIIENNDKNNLYEKEKENENNKDLIEKGNEEENLKYININNIDKIVCPECGELSILEINHRNYILKSTCPNNHIIEDTLINFINRSEEKLEKLKENIECFDCKKKMSQLKNKEKDIYKCKCGKYICSGCKKKHEEQKEENIINRDNKEEEDEDDEDEDEDDKKHLLVNFSEKDFKCTCYNSVEEYYYFCKKCNKNLCNGCEADHPSDHPIFNFSEETEKALLEKDLNAKKEKFKNLKKNINEFLKKLHDLKEKLEQKIKDLEQTLKAYLDVNNYILTKYKVGYWNYQTIKSIIKINPNLTNLYELFINSTSENESFAMLMSLFEYQNSENKTFINKEINLDFTSSIISLPNYLDKSIGFKINEKITSLCQIKNRILVGDQKGQIHFFTFTAKKLKEDYILPDEKGNKIKFLYTLKNGYFISSTLNELKIYQVDTQEKIDYKILQTFKYKSIPNDYNENDINIDIENKTIKSHRSSASNKTNNMIIINYFYYQALELINGYLLYIDGDKLIVLNPTSGGHYIEEPFKEIKLDSNIISLTELNSNKFCLYCENKNLIIYDSNNFKEKTKINLMKLKKFKKIKGVNSDIIAALEDRKMVLISEAKQDIIQEFKIDDLIIYDICTELNKIFLACQNSLIEFAVKANKDGNYLTKFSELPIKFTINELSIIKHKNDKNEIIGEIVLILNDNIIKVL